MEKLNGIYNAREKLGMGKTLVLGLQHVFAMFGATVLVPLLTGLSISVTLFFAGLATLWFHFITKRKIPIFLGSSFAYLAAFALVAPMINGMPNTEMLPYATGGVFISGFVYVIIALFIKFFGVKKVMALFPPVVTGPIIVLIGVILAPSALNNITSSGDPKRMLVGVLAICLVIFFNIWGKGMMKIVPILMGIIISYVVAILLGMVDFSGVASAKLVGLPPFFLPKFSFKTVFPFVVVALVTVIEHFGDIAAISSTTGENYMENPGFVRTLLGDGLGTSMAGLFGGPANTTYSENTGVIALTKVYDPFVIEIAAVFAIIISFSPSIEAIIYSIPSEIIGGISFILYGMISAVGLRNLVESQVDFTESRNIIIAAIILVSGLAFNSSPIVITLSEDLTLEFGGLASAAIFGIILNILLPGRPEFKTTKVF